MNKKVLITVGIVIIIGIALIFLGSNSPFSQQSNTMPHVNTQTQGSSTSNQTTQSGNTQSQDPQDIVPGLYKNLIQNTATIQGFKISSIIVENNTDAAGNPVSDHLQLTLHNLTNQDLTNFEVYYTITDTATNKKEGYYKKLTTYVLKAGATQTIHFDNKSGDGHFTVNTHSLYFTSTNKLQFTVMVSTPSYKTQTATIEKAAGGAETKD